MFLFLYLCIILNDILGHNSSSSDGALFSANIGDYHGYFYSAAYLNSSKDDIPNHWRRFWSHEFLLLFGPLLASTFPCRMSCNSRYLFFLIICPKYSIFLLFTVNVTSFVLSIFLSTSSLVVYSIHETRYMLRYIHISNDSSLLIKAPVMVHALTPYKRTGRI